MGSIVMHAIASREIFNKYNLSDKFMAGCIMPDIYSKCGIDRNIIHFIDESNSNLPNYNNYIKIHKDISKDDLKLGYLSHLIQDYVWYSKFDIRYVKIISNDPVKVKYLFDNSVHTSREYDKDMYKDYDYMDNYLCKKYNFSIEDLKSRIITYYDFNGLKENLDKYFCLHEYDSKRKNLFLTQEDVDEYIEMSIKVVDDILSDIL